MSFVEKVKKHRCIIISVGIAGLFFVGGYFTHSFVATNQRPSGGFDGNGGSFTRMDDGAAVPTGRSDGTGSSTVSGTIVSNSGSYITIKLGSGSTKNVYIGDSTAVYSQTEATTDQLTTGKTISVQGTTNSDNSIQGTTITVK